MTTLVVIAKETLPGKVKTRLHPPLSLEQAAELAAASLADTLSAVAQLPATRRILLFDGNRLPPGSELYEVMDQVEGDLDMRLGAMFDELDGPTILIGMDTPQVTAELLAPVFDEWPADVDAWFGPATDGGFWALALAEPTGDLVRGVPMSRADTGRIQLERLRDAGLSVRSLDALEDVDTFDNAVSVARIAPSGRFAGALARMTHGTADGTTDSSGVVTR
ncbi:glycosyltransferase A (GT-A) superfamily protein (DUF2064 family) [Mycetocola sp. CAN_C7]|uniref:TIGR04282 family arsenosugar biosynthesis glycosyltransferase n=1 Tax=Mycetocola sp. CAN_C7 TaxID=2787724 RepID=UPI0018CA1D4D